MTVYLDVLIILNIYVNYFLIRATSKFSKTPVRTARLIIASIVGSLFCLTIVFPKLSVIIQLLIKLAAAFLIILTAFGFKNKSAYFRLAGIFYLINFIFAGIIYAIWLFFKPPFLQVHNSYFYIDFSLLTLVVATAVAYIAVSVFRLILDRKEMLSAEYQIVITHNGNTISLEAFADTGNRLIDFFSGKPVIFCRKNLLSQVISFPEVWKNDNIPKGFRLLPFNTLNSSGMVATFTPDRVYLKQNKEKLREIFAVIGISDGDFSEHEAIFNPNLI